MNRLSVNLCQHLRRTLDPNVIACQVIVPHRCFTKKRDSTVRPSLKTRTADVNTQLVTALAQTEVRIDKKRKWRVWGIFDRGLHAFDGDMVVPGQLLCRQYDLMYHPGQYVDVEWDGTLRAKEGGRMMITSEIIDPDWNNEMVQQKYAGRKGHLIFKKHIHIIPNPLPKKFKLATLI
ncbi:uncharacterized protein LOC129594114 [Paramacrobiotus metropolitanus]|uniref:uncharacterized protein LOC129594114 n=1 Tax=Paramacrobiotus metropolitanus TaxID=2943436 RepID=UPI0024462F04|nr:uncharacterized protein LOC129594114 [Paramacrobiotus metropolitanus]